MPKDNLVVGFSESENKVITQHLKRLLLHLEPDRFVLVGGLAIRYHLVNAGIPYNLPPFSDIDLIVKDESVIRPSINQDFLIAHRHLANKPWFYIVIIDPVLKVKVHVFDYEMKPEKVIKIDFDGFRVNLVSLEDQLVKLVWDTQRISAEQNVRPKEFKQAKLLMKIADMKLADQIWRRKKFSKYPPTLSEAIERADKLAQEHPEWLNEKVFFKPKPYKCSDCVSSEKFPIAPMEKVYQIMES